MLRLLTIAVLPGLLLLALVAFGNTDESPSDSMRDTTPMRKTRTNRSTTGGEHRSVGANVEIAALRAQLERLEQRMNQTKNERPPSRLARYEDLEPAARDQAIALDLDGALEREVVDESWRASTEEWLASAVAEVDDTSLLAVRCASSFCRAVLSHESAATRRDDLRRLIDEVPWSAGGFVQVLHESPPKSVWYFAREGYTLPPPPIDGAN